jgi:hypothetical protein
LFFPLPKRPLYHYFFLKEGKQFRRITLPLLSAVAGEAKKVPAALGGRDFNIINLIKS